MQNNLSNKKNCNKLNNNYCNNSYKKNSKKFSFDYLFEIENFLDNFSNICKGIKLYKIFKD